MKYTRLERLAKEESGVVLIMSMLIIVLLTLVGIGLVTTSSTELIVSGNEQLYRVNFALAEAAAREGLKELVANPYRPGLDSGTQPIWLHKGLDMLNPLDPTDPINWDATVSAVLTGHPEARYMVRYDPPSSPDAAGTTPELVFKWTIFGRSNAGNGEVVVQIGYSRRMSIPSA